VPLGEFELIEKFFARAGATRSDVILGVGDDAALLAPPPGQQLAFAADTLVEGIHFPEGLAGEHVGHRVLAVNLSDMAAMGAEPAWALLTLTLPRSEESWLGSFARGLDALARRYRTALVGGDTTAGPLTATVAIAGFAPPGLALRRAGAKPGDLVYVSGTPGDAAAGLAIMQGGLPAAGASGDLLWQRFLAPEPRVALGLALRGLASACIDVSDGLAGDLGKLCAASGIGADLESRRLPLSNELRVAAEGRAVHYALGGGDDYELLFTVPPAHAAAVEALDAGVTVTRIGEIRPGAGVTVDGARAEGDVLHGFDHFAR
jgi:thiamine-monophosphate kinase